MPLENAAVLLATVWLEEGQQKVRARLVYVVDLRDPARAEVVAGGPDEVASAVRDWVVGFLRRQQERGT